ncbi:MAG: pilus assembly protein [Acidobacteria bacterium]|nr:pilus assembly protein [Acidobacteriota bacterium]
MRPISLSRKPAARGNTLVEFALVISFLVPILLGVFSIGMSLTASVQASVVARDAGSMFMRYVDFSINSNKSLIVRIARGMGMTETGGNGTVILTQILRVGAAQCIPPYATTTACPNFNRHVITKRVIIGNATLTTSTFGTPTASIVTTDGSITAANYLANTTARADAFDALMILGDGETAFISEAYFLTPNLNLPGFRTDTFVYQRSIF